MIEKMYAILYTDGELVLSNTEIENKKNVRMDYGQVFENNIPWNENLEITSVMILDKLMPLTCADWFFGCKNLKCLKQFENLCLTALHI